jgi:hypothetical protein
MTLNAYESTCVHPIGYVGPTRSASLRTEVKDVVTRFESHTALAEIDPNPESQADIVKIQLVFFILIEIIGR